MEQKELNSNMEKVEAVLEELGFKETKPKLWAKQVDGGYSHWDFRKTAKGRFYVSNDTGGFEDAKKSKNRDEYIEFRKIQNGNGNDKPSDVVTPEYIPPKKNEDTLVLRGNEIDIARVIGNRRLDIIAKASKAMGKDGVGEGVLYHNLGSKIGFEPSADFIDMICCDMGGIETKIVESGMHRHVDVNNGEEYQTTYAIVHAIDTIRGTVGIGSAEGVIDYDEMKKTGRSFAFTKVLRKARRNAIERLIPVPRKALVELVKDLIQKNSRGDKK